MNAAKPVRQPGDTPAAALDDLGPDDREALATDCGSSTEVEKASAYHKYQYFKELDKHSAKEPRRAVVLLAVSGELRPMRSLRNGRAAE